METSHKHILIQKVPIFSSLVMNCGLAEIFRQFTCTDARKLLLFHQRISLFPGRPLPIMADQNSGKLFRVIPWSRRRSKRCRLNSMSALEAIWFIQQAPFLKCNRTGSYIGHPYAHPRTQQPLWLINSQSF